MIVPSKEGLRRKGFEPDNRRGTLKVPSKFKLLDVTLEFGRAGAARSKPSPREHRAFETGQKRSRAWINFGATGLSQLGLRETTTENADGADLRLAGGISAAPRPSATRLRTERRFQESAFFAVVSCEGYLRSSSMNSSARAIGSSSWPRA